MAANVETMVYVREKPWHGLGTMVQEAMTSEEALRLAELDWTVDGKPIYTEDGMLIPGYVANTRSKDGSVLGVVTGRYTVVQNTEAFAFTDALIGEGVTYETAGSLRKGKQIWLLARMPENVNILGDEVEPYLCFTNTHDGSGAVRACMTPIRVVCNNTLNAALRQAKRSWSTPHVGDVQSRIEEAKRTLELAGQYMTALDEEADRLANEKLDEGGIIQAVSILLPMPEKPTDRQKKTVQDARDGIISCCFAPDLAAFAGTKWGFLNAVADYVGHAAPVRQTQTYEERRWGDIIGGAKLFDAAYAYCGAKE